MATTSTISIRVYPGTPNERTAFLTRQTPAGNSRLGFNVAEVDILNGTIRETSGTRAAVSAFGLPDPVKIPE